MWYYAKDREKIGPLDEAAFQQRIASGEVTPATLVWTAGMADWQPWGDVMGLSAEAGQRAGGGITEAAGAHGGGVTACAQCGREFSTNDMVRFEGDYICADCKPTYFQRLQEGGRGAGALNYASFGQRFVAKLLDGIILGVASAALQMALGAMATGGDADPESPAVLVVAVLSPLLGFAIQAAYVIYFLGTYGATPGKMALGIKVVRPDGASLTYGRATGRWAAEIITSLTLLIGYIMAAFDKEHRALHDLIADTRVVDR